MRTKTKILFSVLAAIALAILTFITFAVNVAHKIHRFSSIKMGMSMSQVQAIVGVPDSRRTNSEEMLVQWFYNTEWPGGGGTSVFFYTNGVYNIYTP